MKRHKKWVAFLITMLIILTSLIAYAYFTNIATSTINNQTELYSGAVSNLNLTELNANLGVGLNETLDFVVSLPTTANNTVQGLTSDI